MARPWRSATSPDTHSPNRSRQPHPRTRGRAGPLRQWAVLTRRSADLLIRNWQTSSGVDETPPGQEGGGDADDVDSPRFSWEDAIATTITQSAVAFAGFATVLFALSALVGVLRRNVTTLAIYQEPPVDVDVEQSRAS